ncbi:MAG: hypothetical protein KAX40_08320 [Herpetosiphon sp.]|nr:hypothetical protein [Herpetosiphon sp.]
MRLFRRNVVRPTLMFSAAGVMVEAFDEPMFSETSPPLVVGKYREIDPPKGSAVVAVQFIHTIGEAFANLQTFKLHYYTPQATSSFFEDYLQAPGASNDLTMRAVSVGADSLSRDQKRTICMLLSKSDQHAWEVSAAFRQILEK